ncbi:MAG: Uma2 family endonuclease [Promethearchaeota archaeon]
MTQKNIDSIIAAMKEAIKKRGSTRIANAPPDLFDPNKPRLGRRESEPHSREVTYMYDVLSQNFPESRALWDLHHYFIGNKGAIKGKKIDIQFDVSFFKDFKIPYTLSSYDAQEFNGRIPDMAINVLSKSTWKTDLSENVDICKDLEIPVYIVFSPYKVTSKIYHPPFLRAYILKDDGLYQQKELRTITLEEGGNINEENIIDVSDILPFRIGLMQLKQKHKGDLPLYRLVFIHPSELKILPSSEDKLREAEEKAQKAEVKAKEAEEKAQKAEMKAKEAEEKIRELEKLIEKYRKFEKID